MGIIRIILALSVVFTHIPSYSHVLVGGRNAVQMFYMISGFLISYVLLNTPAYRRPFVFWSNRALRLYPIYYVVAAMTLIGYTLFAPSLWKAFLNLPAAAKGLVAIVNVSLIGQDWPFFVGVREGGLILSTATTGLDAAEGLGQFMLVIQAWTLSLELSFYFIAPFIVRRRFVLLSLFVTSLCGRLFAISSGFGLTTPWDYRFFPFELALFIGGMFSHQLLHRPISALVAANSNKNLPTFVVTLLIVICVFYYAVPLPEYVKVPVLMVLFLVSLPFIFIFQSQSKWDKLIGDISYPLYIGHFLVLLTLAYLIRKYEFVAPLSLARAMIGVTGALEGLTCRLFPNRRVSD